MTNHPNATRSNPLSGSRIVFMALLAFVALAFQSSPTFAQWASNSVNINNTNTGNVGVGNTAPSAKLHITSTAGGIVTVKIIAQPSQTANLMEFRSSDDVVRSYINSAGALVFNPAMNLVPAAVTVAPNFNGSYYATSEHNAFTINGANMAHYGLYTNPPVRMFLIKDVNGLNAFEINKIGMATFRGDMSNRPWVTNLHVDSSNSYYAGDVDGLLINGTGLTTHGLYSGGTVRMLRVIGTGEALAVTRNNLTGFGTLTPAARVEIIGTGNTSATAALNIKNSSAAALLSVKDNGRVGIGTATPAEALDVVGNITVSGNIAAKYQDLAEWVPSAQALSAGTVVTLAPNKSNHVEASLQAYDTRVAGVVSAQPGITLGEAGDNKLLVATTGRVKIKVDASLGPIQVGDLLVTSDVPGVAMKSQPIDVGGVALHRPGTLIGKALEPLAKGRGEILALLSLQ